MLWWSYVVFQCVFGQLISAQRLKQRRPQNVVGSVTDQFIRTVQSTVIPFTPVRKELYTCNQRTQDMFNSSSEWGYAVLSQFPLGAS